MNRLLTGMVAILILSACSDEHEPKAASADIEAGKQFALTHCTGCHTLQGRGKTSEIPNLAAQPAEYLSNALNAYRDGTRNHAALKGLIVGASEADINNIAAYFASLPPVQTAQAAGDAVYDEGRKVAAICENCHGEGGHSTTSGLPSLAGPAHLGLSVTLSRHPRVHRGGKYLADRRCVRGTSFRTWPAVGADRL